VSHPRSDSDETPWWEAATEQDRREAVVAPTWRQAAAAPRPSERSRNIVVGVADSPKRRLRDLQPALHGFCTKVWTRVRRAPGYHGPRLPDGVSRDVRIAARLVDAVGEPGKVSILERDLANPNPISPEYLDALARRPVLEAVFYQGGVEAVLATANLTPIQREILDYVLAGTPSAKAISGFISRSPWATSTQLDRAHQKLRKLANDARPCLVCGDLLASRHRSAKYCSATCRQAAGRAR
jgi:hypothetical protein